jgi:hypothetical protein
MRGFAVYAPFRAKKIAADTHFFNSSGPSRLKTALRFLLRLIERLLIMKHGLPEFALICGTDPHGEIDKNFRRIQQDIHRTICGK